MTTTLPILTRSRRWLLTLDGELVRFRARQGSRTLKATFTAEGMMELVERYKHEGWGHAALIECPRGRSFAACVLHSCGGVGRTSITFMLNGSQGVARSTYKIKEISEAMRNALSVPAMAAREPEFRKERRAWCNAFVSAKISGAYTALDVEVATWVRVYPHPRRHSVRYLVYFVPPRKGRRRFKLYVGELDYYCQGCRTLAEYEARPDYEAHVDKEAGLTLDLLTAFLLQQYSPRSISFIPSDRAIRQAKERAGQKAIEDLVRAVP